MPKDYVLTTCGLSCDLCDSNTTKIQDSAKYLLKLFEDPMFFGILTVTGSGFKEDNFPAFQHTLDVLSKFPACPGCQGRKDCAINQCAEEKGIVSCAKCDFLNSDENICSAPLEPPKNPMMPPAPIFFNGLSKRYQNWNTKNLKAMKEGKKQQVNEEIEELIKAGKSSDVLIDKSVNYPLVN